MGAMLAATTHAPLMAIIMISEMTLSYQLVLPLMLSCVAAYTVARLFRTESMYAASLRRQRARSRSRLQQMRIGGAPLHRPLLPGLRRCVAAALTRGVASLTICTARLFSAAFAAEKTPR